MKRKLLTIISLLVLLACVFCVFAACDDGTPDSGDNGGNSENGGTEPEHTHSFTTKTVADKLLKTAATCENPAEYYYMCADCGEKGTDTYTDGEALGHDIITSMGFEATCTQPGLTNGSHCTRCDSATVEQEEIPELGHDMVTDEAVEPTCTETGLTAGEHCSRCDDVTVAQEEIPELGHDMVTDEAVEPTCTETGLTAGEHCSRCDGATVAQQTVPANGHSFTSKTVESAYRKSAATCSNAAVYYYKCAGCDDKGTATYSYGSPKGHTNTEWRTEQAATCTENGTKSEYCKECGNKLDTTITMKLGHLVQINVVQPLGCTQDGIVKHECSRNGCSYSYTITTKGEHNMQLEETVEATCTVDGFVKYGCTKCESEKMVTVIRSGHSYTSEVTRKATVSQKGVLTYTCSSCEDSYTEDIPILKAGVYVLLVEDQSAWRANTNIKLLNSLVSDGYIAGWSKITSGELANADLAQYGIIYIANDQSSATYARLGACTEKLRSFAHGGGVVIYGACDNGWSSGNINYTLPGGVGKGNYYSYRNYIVNGEHPIVTGALTNGLSLTNDLLYHNYTSHTYFINLTEGTNIILQDANGKPTLIEYGIGNGYVIASGLTWEHNAVYRYNAAGSYANTVYDDLIVYAATLINACEHEYDKGVVHEPSCTESGYKLYTCALCGMSYRDEIVQPYGHDVTNWAQTKDPTCIETGIESGSCKICGEVATREVAIIEHSYTSKTATSLYLKTRATCTTPAVYYYKCATCVARGSQTYSYGDTIGHSFTEKSITSTYLKTPATATSHAVYYYKCANCTAKGELTFEYETGKITGRVRNTSGSLLSGVTVTVYKNGSVYLTATTDSNGSYTFANLPYGDYVIKFTKSGYITNTQNYTLSMINAQNADITLVSEEENMPGYVYGVVTDASTTAKLAGITIYVRAGSSNTTGDILSVLTTDNGSYRSGYLTPGNYTLQFVDNRNVENKYTTTYINVVIRGNTGTAYDVPMSNGLMADSIRIVLTWGSSPSDLDSYLAMSNGPTVYYSNKNPLGAGASLDVDDTSAYGPETITISTIKENTKYHYYVHNYSGETALSNSGANVKIYVGGAAEPIVLYVPAGSGRYWDVFTYDSATGKLDIINTIRTYAPTV